jgi:hypothetical protein
MSATDDSITWFKQQYERLETKREIWARGTRLSRIASNLGFVLFFLSYIALSGEALSLSPNTSLPIAEQNALAYSKITAFLGSGLGLVLSAILVASLAMLILSKQAKKKYEPQLLTREELCYLSLYPALKQMDYLQQEPQNLAQSHITKYVREILGLLGSNKAKLGDLEIVRKEIAVPLTMLKKNIRNRLIPSMTSKDPEVAKKSIADLRQFGRYLLNPNITDLNSLNSSLMLLPEQPRRSPLDFLFRASWIPIARFAMVGVLLAISAYIAGQLVGVSKDTSFLSAVTILGAVLGSYVVTTRREKS